MEKLIELSDHEIRIDFALDCKCRTTIRLKSLIYNAPLAFKVQTSSPNKFLVNPPTGLVPPLSSATFQVVLKPQAHPPSEFPRSPADRFLLRTAAAPDLAPDSPESTRPELLSRWFNSDPHRRTFDVKLRVYFVGPFLLARAVDAGHFEAVRGIVKRQSSMVAEFPGREAESLYRAAARFPDILSLLLEAGLRADVRPEELRSAADETTDRQTAFGAAANGDRWMVEILLGAGAGPAVVDVGGYRPAAGVARDKGHTDVVKYVDRGRQLLDAARHGHLDTLKSLLGTGVSANSTDNNGLTPLHVAAIKGNGEAINTLVRSGANMDPTDAEGHTPLHLAVQGGLTDTVRILLERGADANARTNRGATPVRIARLMGHDDIERLLVANGASS
ncbi:Ankyrin repeat domain-containing protein EMB506-chloroplastic [Striga hermonthica]|uniref:Ankyrin repeat domain-containing protein EMB506-chloroplastic n=1 Tax=Striga hermonthica TaxID=68872 RepID=A0A9N7RM59_STRHE|nr:Ankyrin repeat domain-containing protein EMB506-chloroplastic [Striga hermonthica]